MSQARRSSLASSDHSDGRRNSSNKRDSAYESSLAGHSQFTKKPTKKELQKQQALEEKARQQELLRLEKEAMKKAWYLVENYQNKHYEPEKFMKYRNKR